MSKKILITGGDGQLGSHLCRSFFSSYNIIKTSNKKANNAYHLDVTNSGQIESVFRYEKPEIIVNCASYNSVDRCESDKVRSRSVIVDGLSNIVKFSNKDSFIIHISSDYVFNGLKSPYSESDNPNPINYYGKLKLEAENLLIGSNRKHAIIRPNVVFSSDIDNNSNFLGWVVKNLKDSNDIRVVNDQLSNPTPVELLKEVIESIILLNLEGVFNVGTTDLISRYEFALKIAKTFGYNSGKVHEICTEELSQLAVRPTNTFMSFDKICKILDVDVFSLDYYLKKYKEVIFE